MPRFEGKAALVTGAADGIGAAIAQRLAQEGARVVVADINREHGEMVAEQLEGRGTFCQLDVSREDQWQDAIRDAVSTFGHLDILVNNAGISEPGDIGHENFDHWRKVLQTNLDGVFLGTRHAIAEIAKTARKESPGAIVNIGSGSGLKPTVFLAAYGSSKAAVSYLTKSTALYCGQNKLFIRCNAVHPGAVRTAMYERYLAMGPDRDAAHQSFVDNHPIGYVGEPEDIAAAVAFIASDEARFITGADLAVDGGLSI